MASIRLFAYQQKEKTIEEESVDDYGVVTKRTTKEIVDDSPVKKSDSVIVTGHYAEDGKTFVAVFTSTEHKIETEDKIITKYGHLEENGSEVTDDVKIVSKVAKDSSETAVALKSDEYSKASDYLKSSYDDQENHH